MNKEQIALCCGLTEAAAWEAGLRSSLSSGVSITSWPEVASDAEIAVVWSPTQAFLDAHPKLKVLFNMGAGVDALLKLRLPEDARIVRIEDGGMAVQMAEYVAHAVIRHFRRFEVYAAAHSEGQWQPSAPQSHRDFPVGIMGLGVLGARVARALSGFDFPVVGWSQSAKKIDNVTCYAGDAEFGEFLNASRFLVCLLPLTPKTQDIMRFETLSKLLPGGYVINVARGGHLVEEDLIKLIDACHISGATLDVSRIEPLPADHPFRRCPTIQITPHIAAQTVVAEAIAQISAKIEALLRGEKIEGLVDPQKGY